MVGVGLSMRSLFCKGWFRDAIAIWVRLIWECDRCFVGVCLSMRSRFD
ncbi:hypothetical protein [Brunnivagina elsteri]|nr:hypothetical protein [Calothrix elsteri]